VCENVRRLVEALTEERLRGALDYLADLSDRTEVKAETSTGKVLLDKRHETREKLAFQVRSRLTEPIFELLAGKPKERLS
jgi:hypothetical protein